jgi:hypothetical protein
MANRFVRRIKSGDIESIGKLKSEFKELAKLTHPDLHGPGAEAEFVEARSEFEAALRDFEKHRFGARGSRSAAERRHPERSPGDSGEGFSEEAWSCLALFLKRGFPKLSRHEKELLRYEYARWRFLQTLGPGRAGLFDAFERELFGMKTEGAAALDAILFFLRELIEYRIEGLSAMRTQILLSLGHLRANPGIGVGARNFVDFLAGELGIGGELGGA